MNEMTKHVARRTIMAGAAVLGLSLSVGIGTASATEPTPVLLAAYSAPVQPGIVPSFPHPDIPNPIDELKDAGNATKDAMADAAKRGAGATGEGAKKGWKFSKKHWRTGTKCAAGGALGAAAASETVVGTPAGAAAGCAIWGGL